MTRIGIARLTGLVLVLASWLVTAPAFADDPVGRKEGAEPGSSIDPLLLVLLYVAVPLAVAATIAAMVWLPGARANRYRPNKPWTATPVWFAGPSDPVAAVAAAETGDLVRGGASGSW